MLKPLSLKSKLLRSAVLAPVFFMPMAWIFTFCRPPIAQLMMEAALLGAAISFVCAYCVTMYVEAWRDDEKP